ncbi:SpoIIE family protein phosphatase [Streptomyces rishiriensis]|uniref:SpoIIE family protein phosphatase n=1 Tax=Streptomyces rishiriensis TaxID=68264 RepID=UPI0037B9BA75
MPDRALALLIGDVAGHDLDAAAGMARLRNILRAYAWSLEEPPASSAPGTVTTRPPKHLRPGADDEPVRPHSDRGSGGRSHYYGSARVVEAVGVASGERWAGAARSVDLAVGVLPQRAARRERPDLLAGLQLRRAPRHTYLIQVWPAPAGPAAVLSRSDAYGASVRGGH